MFLIKKLTLFNFIKQLQIVLILLVLFMFVSCQNKTNSSNYKTIGNTPLIYEDGFVGDTKCIKCHSKEYNHWQNSHHDLAMQIANDSTVLGNFNNHNITLDGVSYKFTKKDSKFWVHITEVDGSTNNYQIKYTFGVTPLQQYLIDFDNGQKQVLRVTWNTIENKWYHQYSDSQLNPHDWMHWTKSSQNWNTMCSECHSTNLKKNYNLENNSFNTTYASINVSCESCHGPAERHINWAINYDTISVSNTFIKKGNIQLEQMNMCAPCHARRTKLTPNIIVGENFDNQFLIQNLDPEFYHLDGQIKEEDYVYGSFLQSKMYHENVSCTDCHNPHSLQLKKQGNNLCLQCHAPTYNKKQHHFHIPNSEASQCINCHMTGKTYMGNDFRRDHSFRIPRPDQSVTYGTPNACNNCHLNKTNQWATNKIIEWYGTTRPEHFSDKLLLNYKATISETEKEQLLSFINDLSYPSIARATAIQNLPITTSSDYQAILTSLIDTSPIVRFHGLQKFNQASAEERIAIASKHLADTSKLIRINAAQLLNGIDATSLNKINQTQLTKAQNEYKQMLFANADFVNGRLQLANYYFQNNQLNEAIKHYKKTIEMDSLLFPAYANLATSFSLNGNNNQALKTLNIWIQKDPQSSQAFYLRGLLYFEINYNKKAISDLQTALKWNPQNSRIMYNLATYFYKQKDFQKAQTWILKALQINPYNQDYTYLQKLIMQNK